MSVEMSRDEITRFLDKERDGTLLMVDGNKPYGVIVAYCFDGKNIWLGMFPKGRKFKCMSDNPNAAFSVWRSDDKGWQSVLAEGRIEQVKDIEGITYGFKLALEKFGIDKNFVKVQTESCKKNQEKSMMFKLTILSVNGRKSK